MKADSTVLIHSQKSREATTVELPVTTTLNLNEQYEQYEQYHKL